MGVKGAVNVHSQHGTVHIFDVAEQLNERDKVDKWIIEFPKLILFNPSWVKDFIILSSEKYVLDR